MRRSHWGGVIPGCQFCDIRLLVPTSNGCQDAREVAMRFAPVEFAGRDLGRDDGLILCAYVMSCERSVFRFRAFRRIVRSTGLASSSMRPSARNRQKPFQYLAMNLRASPVGDLAETRARLGASQISKVLMTGFECSCRAAWRWSGLSARRYFQWGRAPGFEPSRLARLGPELARVFHP